MMRSTSTRLFALALTLAAAACGKDDDESPGKPDGGTSLDGGGERDADTVRDATSSGAPDARPAGDGSTPPTEDAMVDASEPAGPRNTFVYVGGWDWSGAAYPYKAYALDVTARALTAVPSESDFGPNPSFACWQRGLNYLYITNEWDDEGGGITVASIDPATGALHETDHADSSADPMVSSRGFVHCSLSSDGAYLVAAGYNGGYASSFSVTPTGTISPINSVQLGGSALTHSIRIHPSQRFAVVPNKGLDDIATLSFDASTGQLSNPNTVPGAAGPRHVAFDKAGKFAFVMHEQANELWSFSVASDDRLEKVDERSTLPAGASTSVGSHVLVHPNLPVVYVGNRGHDSIASFTFDGDGKLTPKQTITTRGHGPRHFDISEDGGLFIVANKGDDGTSTGALVLFTVDATGELTYDSTPVEGLKEPTSVVIASVPAP